MAVTPKNNPKNANIKAMIELLKSVLTFGTRLQNDCTQDTVKEAVVFYLVGHCIKLLEELD